MEDKDKTEGLTFFGQWTLFKRPSWALETTEPTCTIPDQSMTIQEIIAKYTRTGLVPQSYLRTDQGGNEAADPGSDPLDDYDEVMEAAKAASGDAAGPQGPAEEPAQESAPGAGEGVNN